MAADPIYVVSADAVSLSGITNRLVVEGSVGTLQDGSIIQESDSGLVAVVERWPRRRKRWTLTWGPDNYESLENLFEVNGRKYPFLFIPPRERDYQVTDHWFASGDGVTTAFQLTRGVLTIAPGPVVVRALILDVLYPIVGTISITVDAVPVVLGVDWSLGALGVIDFVSPPADGAVLHGSFQYATPVRWISEGIDITLQAAGLHELRSASIEEDF